MSETTVRDESRHIAEAFVSARRAARGLESYPGAIPTSLDQAYRIQDEAIALDGRDILGWKVGRIMPPLAGQYGANRLAGPIFDGTIFFDAQGKPVSMAVFDAGFGAAEAEYLLRVGTAPDPAQTSFTLDEAAALIDAVHVGIEIASSPLGAINDLGPAVTISDFGNNNGLVVGAAIPDWRSLDFAAWPVRLMIDGVEAGEASADAMPDGPIGAARFLFELLAERGIQAKPGQWISSGAVTGVHRVVPGARVETFFGSDHRLECLISAATSDRE
ncbi:2-keto-4-pentenoate hydratase [Sphingomonas sp. DBB INV C78]|uniref:2-keto-4-pentenoate hydratase n=1 Tax=Sphingomonas sp. DBB INV C78 TaxID=3349434 RepID=UPI0036D43A3F